MRKKIIHLISGKGTNAINIIKYFLNSDSIQVCLVLSNNKNSPIFENFIDYNVPAEYFDIETFDDEVFEKIKKINQDLIVLAGFLKKISLNPWKLKYKLLKMINNIFCKLKLLILSGKKVESLI